MWTPPLNEKILKLYDVYERLEEAINQTKWYEFLWRKRLKNTLSIMKLIAATIGFQEAIKDLKEFGILTSSNDN
jgi:hypothetical protein